QADRIELGLLERRGLYPQKTSREPDLRGCKGRDVAVRDDSPYRALAPDKRNLDGCPVVDVDAERRHRRSARKPCVEHLLSRLMQGCRDLKIEDENVGHEASAVLLGQRGQQTVAGEILFSWRRHDFTSIERGAAYVH